MSEQTEVLVEETEETIETYDAYADLTQRHSGVLCPNVNCQDRLFSYEKGLSSTCRCGLTWVTGGYQFLKYGVGVPFQHSDVRVISQRLNQSVETEIQEQIAQDLGQTVPETNLEGLHDDLGILSMPDEAAETTGFTIGDSPEPADVVVGPEPIEEEVNGEQA